MARGILFAVIVVALLVIGIFVADLAGVISVPSLRPGPAPVAITDGTAAADAADAALEVEEEEEEDGESRPRRRPHKRAKAVEKPKVKEVPKPRRRTTFVITMSGAGAITTSRLPAELSLDAIHTNIVSHRADVDRCLAAAIERGEKNTGRMLVQMTLDPWGKVAENHIKSDQFNRSSLGRCVLNTMKGWRFPGFSGNPITVAFPLNVLGPEE